MIQSGQIIATSHNLTPKYRWDIPLFQFISGKSRLVKYYGRKSCTTWQCIKPSWSFIRPSKKAITPFITGSAGPHGDIFRIRRSGDPEKKTTFTALFWRKKRAFGRGCGHNRTGPQQTWMVRKIYIRLMKKILHHLGCPKRSWCWHKMNISGILSGARFFPINSTTYPKIKQLVDTWLGYQTFIFGVLDTTPKL